MLGNLFKADSELKFIELTDKDLRALAQRKIDALAACIAGEEDWRAHITESAHLKALNGILTKDRDNMEFWIYVRDHVAFGIALQVSVSQLQELRDVPSLREMTPEQLRQTLSSFSPKEAQAPLAQ